MSIIFDPQFVVKVQEREYNNKKCIYLGPFKTNRRNQTVYSKLRLKHLGCSVDGLGGDTVLFDVRARTDFYEQHSVEIVHIEKAIPVWMCHTRDMGDVGNSIPFTGRERSVGVSEFNPISFGLSSDKQHWFDIEFLRYIPKDAEMCEPVLRAAYDVALSMRANAVLNGYPNGRPLEKILSQNEIRYTDRKVMQADVDKALSQISSTTTTVNIWSKDTVDRVMKVSSSSITLAEWPTTRTTKISCICRVKTQNSSAVSQLSGNLQ